MPLRDYSAAAHALKLYWIIESKFQGLQNMLVQSYSTNDELLFSFNCSVFARFNSPGA